MPTGNRTKSPVALTGATGFVGRHILDRLLAAGYSVRVLVRTPAKLRIRAEGLEIVQGGLSDQGALRRLVADTASVIHCAGLTRGVSRTQFDAVNAAAAGRLASAARAAGVERFMLISSLAAREPGLSPYSASKRGGEEAVAASAEEVGVTILRPPAVYGPGDREMLTLFRMMARGIAPVFGSIDARFSLIHVADLADAVLAWQSSGVTINDPVELDDGQPNGYGWPEVCEIVSSLTGRTVRPLRIPASLLALPAAFNTAAGILPGFDPMFSLGKLRELRHPDWVCRNITAAAMPGWAPRFRLAEGLLQTPGWQD